MVAFNIPSSEIKCIFTAVCANETVLPKKTKGTLGRNFKCRWIQPHFKIIAKESLNISWCQIAFFYSFIILLFAQLHLRRSLSRVQGINTECNNTLYLRTEGNVRKITRFMKVCKLMANNILCEHNENNVDLSHQSMPIVHCYLLSNKCSKYLHVSKHSSISKWSNIKFCLISVSYNYQSLLSIGFLVMADDMASRIVMR